METTSFLAKFIGLWLLIGGIGILFNNSYYQKTLTKFVKDESIMFISGITLLASGLAMVLTYNIWVWNWPVLTTILGWALLIKGFLILALPRQITNVSLSIMKYRSLMIIAPVLWIIGGLVLTYYGFYT